MPIGRGELEHEISCRDKARLDSRLRRLVADCNSQVCLADAAGAQHTTFSARSLLPARMARIVFRAMPVSRAISPIPLPCGCRTCTPPEAPFAACEHRSPRVQVGQFSTGGVGQFYSPTLTQMTPAQKRAAGGVRQHLSSPQPASSADSGSRAGILGQAHCAVTESFGHQPSGRHRRLGTLSAQLSDSFGMRYWIVASASATARTARTTSASEVRQFSTLTRMARMPLQVVGPKNASPP